MEKPADCLSRVVTVLRQHLTEVLMQGKPVVASMGVAAGHSSRKTQHGLCMQPAAMLQSV